MTASTKGLAAEAASRTHRTGEPADHGRIKTAILVHCDVAKADHASHTFGHG